MKTYLLAPLMTIASLSMLAAGGCGPDRVKELEALNRRAAEDNRKLADQKADLERQLGPLQAENNELKGALGRNAGTFQDLNDKNLRLKAANDQLREELKKLGSITVNIGGETLPPEMSEALRALAAAHPELIEFLPKFGMVKFKSDLTFDLGSDAVNPKAADALKKFGEIVNSSAARKFNVYVAGHTDDVPVTRAESVRKWGDNWGLSAARAKSVIRALFQAGVAQDRMAIVGFSKYHPLQANKPGNKGNPANRRVEIWIVSPDRLLTTPSDAPLPTDKPETPAAPASPEDSGS